MSSVSFLEKLLGGVTVEWKPLSDLILRTRNIRWRDVDSSFKYIDLTSVSIEAKKIIETSVVTPNNAPSRAQKLVEKDDVIFATTRPTQMRYCLIEEEYDGEVASTGFCILRAKKEEVLPKWILHSISSSEFKVYLEENQSGSAYPAISDAKLKEFKVPIPCPENPKRSLEIQAEIVRILDTFAELTSELTNELASELVLRQKLYNHYRAKLLNFDNDGVVWQSLEDVANFANGKGHEQDISEDGEYIVVNSKFISTEGKVAKYSNSQICPLLKDDILLVMSDLPNGKALSKTFLVDENNKYTLNQRIGAVTIKNTEIITPKFLYYFLNRNPQLLKHDNGIDQTNLRKGQILEVNVPIVSPARQQKIVEFLEQFENKSKSIFELLSSEIELRRKQYDYYRDLLMTFPKN